MYLTWQETPKKFAAQRLRRKGLLRLDIWYKYNMTCDSKKICGWIQALAQLTVALVILYVGYVVQINLERMVHSWEVTSNAVHMMQQDVSGIEHNMTSMDRRMHELNQRMNSVRQKMSPMNMMMPW